MKLTARGCRRGNREYFLASPGARIYNIPFRIHAAFNKAGLHRVPKYTRAFFSLYRTYIRAPATHGVIFARDAARLARHRRRRRRRRGWFHPSRASCPIPRRAEHISGARIRVPRVGGALRMIIENPRDARTCFPPATLPSDLMLLPAGLASFR